jgi:hypothetical protein
MVGTTSIAWWDWWRTSPFASIPFGQCTTIGSQTPPWYE